MHLLASVGQEAEAGHRPAFRLLLDCGFFFLEENLPHASILQNDDGNVMHLCNRIHP